MVKSLSLIFSMVLLCLAWPAASEQVQTFGAYTVHYNAFTTDALSPEMAKLYNITRSKNRALLNVSILKQAAGAITKPVKARVNATTTNLHAQLDQLAVREVIEAGDPGAIYYLAESAVRNGDTLNYNVNFTPEGEAAVYSFTYQQQFITE